MGLLSRKVFYWNEDTTDVMCHWTVYSVYPLRFYGIILFGLVLGFLKKPKTTHFWSHLNGDVNPEDSEGHKSGNT